MQHDKANIYGASLQATRISSYGVTSNSTLQFVKSVAAGKRCAGHTSAFVLASDDAPYPVFAAAWPGPSGCGMSFTVDAAGSLDRLADSWAYTARSGVHGLAFGGADKSLLYSADLSADAIWTHKVSAADAKVSAIGSYSLNAGSHPRHVVAHPNGAYVYAVLEAVDAVIAYKFDGNTQVVASEDSAYSLIPSGT